MNDPQPAEGNVGPAGDTDAEHTVAPQETPQEEAPSPDPDSPLAGLSMDEVVSAVLQGKFSTDAAEQRRRLAAAGYDPEEVKEAVQRRLAQRYE